MEHEILVEMLPGNIKIKIIWVGTFTNDFRILGCFFGKSGLKIFFLVIQQQILFTGIKSEINFNFQQNIFLNIENKFLV